MSGGSKLKMEHLERMRRLRKYEKPFERCNLVSNGGRTGLFCGAFAYDFPDEFRTTEQGKWCVDQPVKI